MCFSPQASFGAAAILSVLGIRAIRNAKNHHVLIAAVPFFFGIQQALEGIVWITLQQHDTTSLLSHIGVYGFLFFASVWWPLYIPIVFWHLETNFVRKKWLIYPIIAGFYVVGVAFFNVFYGGVQTKIIEHHIAYQIASAFPYQEWIYYVGLASYLIATAGALFISTIPHAWVMGMLVLLAFATAHLWYYYAFGSVWCFFAAVWSGLIIYLF